MRYTKQLGVFAKGNIALGELILQEKSLLSAVSRLHESYCDACSAPLPRPDESALNSGDGNPTFACDECEDVFFCSADCQNLAQAQYHPALCGISTEQKVSASDAADSLYTLLLIRAIALAKVQDVHPLDLKEVRFIWGDYHGLNLERQWKLNRQGCPIDPFGSVPQTLPFTFKHNILTPLNILEKMAVNIFEQSHRYDTWIFNTLFGKFRGK